MRAGFLQKALGQSQGIFHGTIHVVVPVFRKATAAVYAWLSGHQAGIPRIQRLVTCIVNRVVRLIPRMPSSAVFPADHCMRLRSKGEVLVLNHAGIGNLGIRIIDDSISLVVGDFHPFGFEADPAVLQRAIAVVKIRINAPV